jgi:hypothetical protein
MWKAVVLIAALLLVGCDDTTRHTVLEVKSPDGLWTARIFVEQHAGPGNAAVFGCVQLLPMHGNSDPIQVLLVEQQSVKDHPLARWRDPTHLDLEVGEGQIDFQAVKAAGVEITTIRLM